MRILVTGGAGFIGLHLVDALLTRGHRVRVLDNFEPQVHEGRRPDYLNAQAEYFEGDVRDAAAVRHALAGIEVVFHEAAMVGVGQSMYQVERYLEDGLRDLVQWGRTVAAEDHVERAAKELEVRGLAHG